MNLPASSSLIGWIRSVLAMIGLLCTSPAFGQLKAGDAVYRQGGWLNGLDHAGVYAGDGEVYHIPGYLGNEVEMISFATFLDGLAYRGSFATPGIQSTDRTNVLDYCSLLDADPEVSYTVADALNHISSAGTIVNPGEITDLRCDGLVEYVYEYNYGQGPSDTRVWGRANPPSSSGTPQHHDISVTAYVEEHNDLGGNQPWVELSPYVQRGAAGSQWTRFVSTASTSGDGYEVDDTAAQAKSICSSCVQTHSVHLPSDIDWVKFTLTQTAAVTIETDGDSGGDTILDVFGPNSSSLFVASDDDSGTGTYSLLQITLGAGTYWARVSQFDATEVIGSYTIALDVCSAPTAPTSVSATDGACGAVTVTWSGGSGATGYELWRNTSSSSASAQFLSTDGASPYTDSTATAGTTYWYWVKATGTCGSSGFSPSDTGSAGASATAPTSVSATDGACGAVTVIWSGGSGATGYEVWRGPDESVDSAQFLAVDSSSPYIDLSSAPGVTQWYWVKATDSCGPSGFSPSDAGWSGVAAPAPAVTSTTEYCEEIYVTFGPSSSDPFTTIELWRASDASMTNAEMVASEPMAQFNDYEHWDTDVTGGSSYWYAARVITPCGASPFSAAKVGSALTAEPPAGLVASTTLCGRVELAWQPWPGGSTYSIWRLQFEPTWAMDVIGTVGAGVGAFVDSDP